MKRKIVFRLLILVFGAHLIVAQMTVKDSDTHVLMQVNDEGTVGSVSLPEGPAAPSSPAGKLYNFGGSLYWGGEALAVSGSAGGWTDDGTTVRLTTATDSVGIGTTSPSSALTLQNSESGDWNHMLTLLAPNANDNIHTAGIVFGRGESENESAVLHFVPASSVPESRISFGVWQHNDLLNIKGTGRVGIGTTDPQNNLDVEGAAVIGSSYSGTESAPTNGLLVEGHVGIGTSSALADLTVGGPLIFEAAYATGSGTDLTDTGYLSSRVLSFTKLYDDTKVRVLYSDTFSVYGASGAQASRWSIKFNGSDPPGGAIYKDEFVSNPNNSYSHSPASILGYASGLSAGTYSIQIYVDHTPSYTGSNATTGWYSSTWAIEAQEVW